jgi:hypothetical protein
MTQTFTVSGKAPFNPATQVNLALSSPPVRIRNKSGITRAISVGLPGPRTVGPDEVVSVYGHIAPLYLDLQPDFWEAVDAVPAPAPEVNPVQAAMDAHNAEVAAAEAAVKAAEDNLAAAEAAEHTEEQG